MDYLASKFQNLVTPETSYPFESAPCAVVPNASVSTREIFNLYSRGVEVPHLNHQNEPVIHGGHYPTDPMEALQCAQDYIAALPPAGSTEPPAGSTEPQTGSTEPQMSAPDTSAPPAAD